MFKLNGREFAPLSHREAEGYYKRTSHGVLLYDKDRKLCAYAQANDRFTGVVSASIHNGRPYYMYGLNSLTEQWLGLDSMSYSDERQAVINAISGG